MTAEVTRPVGHVDVPNRFHRESRMARLIRWADDYTLWAFNPPDALAPGGSPSSRAGAGQPEDPAATLRDLEHERSMFDRHLDDLHEESARAVRMLRRRGWSFGRIAAETGISIQRVAQLARSSLGAAR